MDRNQILTSFATSRQSRNAAEDVTQNLLALLHEKYAHVTVFTTLALLAFQVLCFKMLEVHRKSLPQGEYNQELIEDHPMAHRRDDLAKPLDRTQLVDRLLSAMAPLGERCGHLFRLKLEGNSFPTNSRSTGSIRGICVAGNSCWV